MITRVSLMNDNMSSFVGRTPSSPRQIMNEILTPLVDSFTPLKEMIKRTIYSGEQINRWSRIRFGMTIAMLYRTRLKEKLKDEFIEHRNKRTTIREMANIYGQDEYWINKRYEDLGIDRINNEKIELIKANVPWMLDAGYSLLRMQDELKVSGSTISRWIMENMGCTVREYRNAKNITWYVK